MRLSIWSQGKGADFRFIDRTISEYFNVGGTDVYVHLYQGVYSQDTPGFTPGDIVGSDSSPNPSNLQTIEDVLFGENRDRKYSQVVIPIRGIYTVTDVDFDMKQFGLFLSNDTLFIEFHLNDMIACCGRRLIPGDVIELPHQRDDTIPNGLPAINKFYVVQDANRAAEGYSITWWPHIWRIKVDPMPAAQEFEDILQQTATNPLGFATPNTLADILSTAANDLGLNEAIVEAAQQSVPKRFFETRQYYIVQEGVGENSTVPWIYTGGGDGIPPNGAALNSGYQYPSNPNVGDYFLRTDWQPAALLKWTGTVWCLQEVDWRGTEWTAATDMLKSFINNNATETYPDGLVLPVRQSLSKAIKPRADFITWTANVAEVCVAVDTVDTTIDTSEILLGADVVDSTYVTLSDVEESNNSVYDVVDCFNQTLSGNAEVGNLVDLVDALFVSVIQEDGNASDTTDAFGSLLNMDFEEVCNAEDATYVFPDFPALTSDSFNGGNVDYTISGLDQADINNIIINTEIAPNGLPNYTEIINNEETPE